MKKMYCYDCNKDVNVIEKVKKEKYQYRHKDFFVTEKVYLCPNCNNKLIDEELDNSLYNIYNGFLKLYNLSLNIYHIEYYIKIEMLKYINLIKNV